jgi:hypothetical protein
MFYSVMNHLPGPQQQAIKKLLELEAFIIKKVEQNQETLDPNSPRNVIDSFLIRMQEVHPSSLSGDIKSQTEGNHARKERIKKDPFELA